MKTLVNLFLFTTLTACAHSPLLQEWDFSTHPPAGDREYPISEHNKRIIEYGEKRWGHAVLDDVLILEVYDKNGNLVSTVVGR